MSLGRMPQQLIRLSPCHGAADVRQKELQRSRLVRTAILFREQRFGIRRVEATITYICRSSAPGEV